MTYGTDMGEEIDAVIRAVDYSLTQFIENLAAVGSLNLTEVQKQLTDPLLQYPANWDTMTARKRADVTESIDEIVANPTLTERAIHRRWIADRKAQGWVYGPRYDEVAKTTPDICTWGALPSSRQRYWIVITAVTKSIVRLVPPA